MKNRRSFHISILLSLFSLAMFAKGSFSVYNLKCEQETNPLGIEKLRPRFSWQINAEERNFEQAAWQILVADTPEALDNENGTIWNSRKVNSPASILVPFNGKGLEAGQTYFWKVRIWDKQGNASPWSPANQFNIGLLSEKDWSNAKWIALEEDRKDEIITTGIHAPLVENAIGDKKTGTYRLPQFRKEFAVNKQLKRAIAYVSGLGHFDMFLNGTKVGDNFLDPGWTKYDKCALYVSFDITGHLQQGNNAVGVMLGNGFFNIPRERYYKILTSYGAPKLIMKIQLEYIDGSTQHIVSDTDWKVTESPITFSSIYGGEEYDASKEQEGWKQPGFNDTDWNKAINSNWKTALISQRIPPLKVRDRIPTVRLLQTEKGDWVYDLGQNFSGILQLKVRATDQHPVKLYPAELLNPDNSINQSASGAPFYFTYIPKGSNPTESWQPQFTYYGFRYVQVEGAVPSGQPNPEGLPEIIDITGLHTCNSADEAGKFSCSNEMFNKIYNLIDWSVRSNMASVLTDCPHREKLGWLEVAHLMQYSIQYRYNMARFYEKVMNDMRSTQAENGQIATTAPELVEFEGGFKDTPEWGSAFIISPWYVYQWYGDKQLIEKNYPDMQRYLDYLLSKSDNYIISYGLGDWYDIGPNHPGESQLTSNGVTATAIFYYNTVIMQQIASLLNKSADADKYAEQASRIKEAFNTTFWNKSTRKYDRDSQAANAIALYTGLVEPDNKEQVFNNLIADIRNRNNALTAGDVGYRYVLRALEENNASDVIYDMNCKYDVPGYGWQLAHGATSLTESWQAYGFVSNNHCMLGHLMEWLFSGLGGIRQEKGSIAFKNIVIKPEPAGDIRDADTSYESPYGLIHSSWKNDKKTFSLRVEIPANSSASIYLPANAPGQISESGIPLQEIKGMKFSSPVNGRIKVETGSGIYNFIVEK